MADRDASPEDAVKGVRTRPVLSLVAFMVLALVLAAVLICALLLFGVDPHLVFLPGHAVKSRLAASGVHAHNRVGVLSTVVFWWGIVAIVWLVLRRILRRAA